MRSSSAAGPVDGEGGFAAASADFKFAAAVAGFGLLLQDSPFKGSTSYDDVVVWAEAGLAEWAELVPGDAFETLLRVGGLLICVQDDIRQAIRDVEEQ